jgi:ankyrin repeat protein
MVKALLESGADPNSVVRTQWRTITAQITPLMAAVDMAPRYGPNLVPEENNQALRTMKMLLAHGGDPNLVGEEGQMSALHCAATKEHLDVFKLLLASGAAPNQMDKSRRTPLHLVAKSGFQSMLRALLSIPSTNPSPRDSIGRTPLLEAAESGHRDIVTLLLQRTGSPMAFQNESASFLSTVIASELDSVVQVLRHMQPNADEAQDPRGEVAFLWSAMNGHLEILKLLNDKFPSLRISRGQKALRSASSRGHVSVVECLLTAGHVGADQPRPSHQVSAIFFAIQHGHQDVVRLLLDKGADCHQVDPRFGLTPLSAATREHDEGMVRLLVANYRIDLDLGGSLHEAAKEKQTAIMDHLIQQGADIEYTKRGTFHKGDCSKLDHRLDESEHFEYLHNRGTPLHTAAAYGFSEGIQLLCSRGAKLDPKDEEEQTPLSRAAATGDETSVRLLIDYGARIHALDSLGRTPLCHAAESGSEAVVTLLVSRGASVYHQDSLGRTPLSYAAQGGNEQVVKLLIREGARVDCPDQSQRTLRMYARDDGFRKIERILEAYRD